MSHPSEEYVLGTLLNFGQGLDTCERLDSRCYTDNRKQIVWTAIRELFDEGKPYTADAVHAVLHRDGELENIGGVAYLYELMEHGTSPATLHVHAADLHSRALVRDLAAVGDKISGGASDDAKPEEVIEQAERDILALQSRRETRNESGSRDMIRAAMKQLQAKHDHGDVTGIATGIVELDHMLGGLQPGALYILAARPAMGKTCLALNIVSDAATKSKTPCAVFSLEMSHDELGSRLLAAQARVDVSNPRRFNEAAWSKLLRAQQELAEAPVVVVDSSLLTASELRSHTRKLYAQGKCKLLVVDYLQLMSGDGETREREIGEISRSLKLLAKELRIPVLALSQLNRGVESRTDKRPALADLRDSGSIEQDADVVIFIYRDEVYNENTPDRGIAELLVSKNRHGSVGRVRAKFDPSIQRFTSLHQAAGN